MFRFALMIYLLFSALPQLTYAGVFEDGMTAYEARKFELAYELLLPLAEQGDVNSQLKIAEMQAKGLGTDQNLELALKWYKKAVEKGSAQAEFKMGELYGSGNGLPINYKESNKWYRSAAERGNAQAQYSLGASYFKGQGVNTDYITAYAWMDVSVKQGLESSSRYRDTIGEILSPEKLKKAKNLSDKLFKKINTTK